MTDTVEKWYTGFVPSRTEKVSSDDSAFDLRLVSYVQGHATSAPKPREASVMNQVFMILSPDLNAAERWDKTASELTLSEQ